MKMMGNAAHLVFGVSQFLEDTSKLTLLHASLLSSNCGDLTRGT